MVFDPPLSVQVLGIDVLSGCKVRSRARAFFISRSLGVASLMPTRATGGREAVRARRAPHRAAADTADDPRQRDRHYVVYFPAFDVVLCAYHVRRNTH